MASLAPFHPLNIHMSNNLSNGSLPPARLASIRSLIMRLSNELRLRPPPPGELLCRHDGIHPLIDFPNATRIRQADTLA